MPPFFIYLFYLTAGLIAETFYKNCHPELSKG